MNKDRVFVYGTLMRGQANDITNLRPAPEFLGRARIKGVLFHLGTYPGLILEQSLSEGVQAGWVTGEVYAVRAALWPVLDEIEELTDMTGLDSLTNRSINEYRRVMARVYLDRHDANGTRRDGCSCHVYELLPTAQRLKRPIASGDWRLVRDEY